MDKYEKREENNYARGRKSIVTIRLGIHLDRFTDLSVPKNEERINNNRTRGKDSLRKAVSFLFFFFFHLFYFHCSLHRCFSFALNIFSSLRGELKKREKHFGLDSLSGEGRGGIRCLPDKNKREMFFFFFFSLLTETFLYIEYATYRVYMYIYMYVYFIYTRENEY